MKLHFNLECIKKDNGIYFIRIEKSRIIINNILLFLLFAKIKSSKEVTIMNFKQEILKSIQTMVDKSIENYKADRTYQSIIKEITPKGYVVLDETGNARTVKCCIPGLELRVMQKVWVKEPMGNLKKLHICGVVGK